MPSRPRQFLLAPILLALVACGGGNLLHQYDFSSGTLAVVSDVPPEPDVLSGSLFDLTTSGDPVRDILRIGARVVREVQADEVQAKLDAASTQIDVGLVLEENTLQRSARYLGADAVADADSDYLLELFVVEYGIVADAWDAPAQFFLEADAALLHRDSGTEIWRAEVSSRDPIGPAVWGGSREARDLLTAVVLASLEVDQIVQILEGLADYSAGIVTDRLRNDLRDARRR